MYDLIIVKNSKKKRIIEIIILVIFVIVATIGGIKLANYTNMKKQQLALQKQQEQEKQLLLEKQKQEEEAKQRNIKKHKSQTSRPLTDAEKYRIHHIYTSEEKRVFLTFDDGPTQNVTPLILDLLNKENIKATFFVLGNNARNNKDIIKREFNEGHYIANHGYSHKYSAVYASPEATLEEYNTTEQAIKDALEDQSYSSKLFRFPGGSNGGYYDEIKQASKALLRENGVVHLDWNCLSKDAEGAKTKETLLQNAIDTMQGKNSVVILMHDSSDKILTYEMLPELISYLREQGYKFENIYDLLDD